MDAGTGRLGPDTRAENIRALENERFDVIVVGGGVVGAGIALDAALRGCSVALLEANDIASGASSKSSKLIHGGLRYLEMLDFKLLREALTERSLLLHKIAPHLVRDVPFLFPLKHHVWERAYVGAGVTLYDNLARTSDKSMRLPKHRHVKQAETFDVFPSLRRRLVNGSIMYHDAQVDDSRFAITLARTAAAHGARVVTGCEVTGVLRMGKLVVGVNVMNRDDPTRTIDVDAGVVINATGVWTPEADSLLGERVGLKVRMSKGVHIVVPRDCINGSTALITRAGKSVLFVLPWNDHWIIGTTDTPWNLDPKHAVATARDIDYLLDQVNELVSLRLTRKDIKGVYAGLRPLIAGASGDTTKVKREHAISNPAPGFVAVAGGKFTTYRVMAKQAVDVALGSKAPRSLTAETPLLGLEGLETFITEDDPHLFGRYGSMVDDITALTSADPSLNEPIPGAPAYKCAEAHYAVSHEGARHLEDVLTRRTHIDIETWDRGVEAAEPVANIMAKILSWPEPRVAAEVAYYKARVKAELRANKADNDSEAADIMASVGSPPEG